MATPVLPQSAYTIGWICALPIELAAARALLDERHSSTSNSISSGNTDSFSPQHSCRSSDSNSYSFGRIAGHNIVLACLPQGTYGTNAACAVAANILASFPQVRFGLLVGVGGGIPRPGRDVRLGDVVVSQPEGKESGVVQYDLGKVVGTKEAVRVGVLDKPPVLLRTAISDLEAEDELEGSKIGLHVERMLAKKGMSEAFRTRYGYQGAENDKLFEAEYDHVDSGDGDWEVECGACDRTKVVARAVRSDTCPRVHYGIIASGNHLIKHAATRDIIGKETGAICFEMEAAGLMDNFPCVVIRGICDYADSHKNKRWQRYAAATAAAYAKELLQHITPQRVYDEPLATEAMKAALGLIQKDVAEIKMKVMATQHIYDRQQTLRWLSEANYGAEQTTNLATHQDGTGLWLLNSQRVKDWQQGDYDTLYCTGIPGAGKTIMTSIMINHMIQSFPPSRFAEHRTGIVFIYFSYNRSAEQSAVEVMSALLKQMVQQLPSIPECVGSLHETHSKFDTKPTLAELRVTILSTVDSCYSRLFVAIDGLDECADEQCGIIVCEIRAMQQKQRERQGAALIKLLATSRDLPRVSTLFQKQLRQEIKASKEDVQRYAHYRGIPRLPGFIARNTVLQAEIVSRIAAVSDGMFLLAHLLIESLTGKPSVRAVRDALQSFSQDQGGLDHAYLRVMERINDQKTELKRIAARILCWLVLAKRRLTVRELQHALAVEPGDMELDETKLPDSTMMVSACSGLVAIRQETQTVEFVHYTTIEYFQGAGKHWVFSGPTEVALDCLNYLSLKPFAKSWYGPWKRDWTKVQIRISKYPFYSYAARYWSSHLWPVQGLLKDAALAFLRKRPAVTASYEIHMPSPTCPTNAVEPEWQLVGHEIQKFTPLEASVLHKLQELMQALLQNGVDFRERHWYRRTALYWASAVGNIEGVAALLNRGAKVNISDHKHRTPLGAAAKNGQWQVVKLLVERGARITDRKWSGDSLHWAARCGHYSTVQLLINHDANVNYTEWMVSGQYGKSGALPLQLAVENGHYEVAQLLLENGASVNHTPGVMQSAVESGDTRMVQLLIFHGADINGEAFWEAWNTTMLCSAARKGHEAVVRLLLAAGVDVDAADDYFWTPLCYAAYKGDMAVVQILLDAGADINAVKYGRPPICIAAWKGDTAMMQLLIDRGAWINVEARRDWFGDLWGHWKLWKPGFPLGIAVRARQLAAAQLLLKYGADVNRRCRDGRYVFHIAVEGDNEAILTTLIEHGTTLSYTELLYAGVGLQSVAAVRLLLQHGADPNDVGRTYDEMALHTAVRNADLAMIQVLLDGGAEINAIDKNGWMAVHHAVQAVLSKLVGERGTRCPSHNIDGALMLLLERQADPYACTQGGNTALHLVAGYRDRVACKTRPDCDGVLELASRLVERGADIDAKNAEGRTALHIAAAGGSGIGLVRRLLEMGANTNAADCRARTPLHHAALAGHYDVVLLLRVHGAVDFYELAAHQQAELETAEEVRQLLTAGRGVDDLVIGDLPALHYAASRGYAAVVQLLLDHGADADRERTDLEFATALDLAVHVPSASQDAIVDALLTHGASTTAVALTTAVKNCKMDLVRRLLQHCHEPDTRTSFSTLALPVALAAGSVEILQLLRGHGANVNLQQDPKFAEEMEWALVEALENGHETAIHEFLRAPCSGESSERSDHGKALRCMENTKLTSPLEQSSQLFNQFGLDVTTRVMTKAAQWDRRDTIRLILSTGVPIATCAWGTGREIMSAFHMACYWGSEAVALLLLEHGAPLEDRFTFTIPENQSRSGAIDPEMETSLGMVGQPLRFAVEGWHAGVVTHLLAHGAKAHTTDNCKRTTLHLAICSSRVRSGPHWRVSAEPSATVAVLLEYGATDKPDYDNKTCLHYAAQSGYEKVTNLLLRHGSDINAEDDCSSTALHYAASRGHEGIVDRLLTDGACVTARDFEGKTAIHRAAEANQAAVLRLLLLKSADLVDERTVAGESALALAAARGHIKAVRLLLSFDANPLARDRGGRNCLHQLAVEEAARSQNGSTEAEELVNDSTDSEVEEVLNDSTDSEETACSFAAVALLLIEHGVSPHLTDYEGFTASQRASSWMKALLEGATTTLSVVAQ